jgi:hypothetical protein
MSRRFFTTCCGGMGFDSGRGEQIAYFSQCRLLLERVDLCQNCQMLYRKNEIKRMILVIHLLNLAA